MVKIKRLTLALIALCMLCLLVSCAGSAVGEFQKAISSSEYSLAEITVKTTDSLGELVGTYGVTFLDDGGAQIVYSYEKWNKIDDGESDKTTVSGTVVRAADGSFSGDVDGFGGVNAESRLSIDVTAITSAVTESDDGMTIEATVASANTAAVFGKEYAFDVFLKMIRDKDFITTVYMEYESGGVKCEITANYS